MTADAVIGLGAIAMKSKLRAAIAAVSFAFVSSTGAIAGELDQWGVL
jgi:hypothetical protein